MRPRRIRRGRAWAGIGAGIGSSGFNEAAANSPRKVSAVFRPHELRSRFNEAAANSPRKGRFAPRTVGRAQSFNEAAANSPRKEVGHAGLQRARVASMRPRRIRRGRGAPGRADRQRGPASMRPRRIRRGRNRPRSAPGGRRSRFNEAAANSPRKGQPSVIWHPVTISFNEAAANSPRKGHPVCRLRRIFAASMRPRRIRRGRRARPPRRWCSSRGFNEAAANSPRKDPRIGAGEVQRRRFNEAAANSPRKGRRPASQFRRDS